MQRNLKVLVFCLWVLKVAGATFWLANHRDRLLAHPARIVAASTSLPSTPPAAATPTVATATNPTPPLAPPSDPADASTFIAFRYDKTRIVFRLGQEGDFDLDQDQAKVLHTLPAPALTPRQRLSHSKKLTCPASG